MIDHLGIIEKLNKECKFLFLENFKLIPTTGHHNIYVFKIEGTSFAINRYDSEPVKVLRWFDDFWVYIEIRFINEKTKVGHKYIDLIHTYISLSIYQGNDADNRKTQLFRAEWDDLNNSEEKHSQPHWHVTSSQSIERTMEEYSNHFDNGDFISLFDDISSSIYDVKKIHFAMNGNWQEKKTHVHKIISAEQVSLWLQGLLTHIRIELEEN